jgi:hypothetical protein
LKTKPVTFIALLCVGLGGCDFTAGVLARYPPPPAGSFTSVTARITADGKTASTSGASVTPDFFRAYALQPMLGRMFLDNEYREGGARTVLLSENLWRTRFGAVPDVLGITIQIDDAQAVIIGVIPNTFQQPPAAQFWLTSRPYTTKVAEIFSSRRNSPH